MYNRIQLKNAAKTRLTAGGRWIAVLVCLIAAMIGGTVSTPSLNLNFENFYPGNNPELPSFGSETRFGDILPEVIGFITLIALLVSSLVVAYQILVSNVAIVGLHGWFMRYARDEVPPVTHVFLGFRIYGKVVLTMLLRDLFVGLWSLLFLIPGIVKAYSYQLVPYLIYENPSLSPKQALALSQSMMKGWKGRAFKLDLSFIGWRILSALTLGILDILYVNPYYQTAHAMFYESVRYDALYVRGIITLKDLDDEPPMTATKPSDDESDLPAIPAQNAEFPSLPVEDTESAPVATEFPEPEPTDEIPTEDVPTEDTPTENE